MSRFENNYGKIWCHAIFIVIGESNRCTTCCKIVTFVFKSFCSFYFCGIEWWILNCLDQYNSCFLNLLRVTNVQPFLLYDIDSLLEQRWRKVFQLDTCVCFDLDNSHWIVSAHASSVLGGMCNKTGSKDQNVSVAWFDSTTSFRSRWILLYFASFIMRSFKIKYFSTRWLMIRW